ncbi:MAG: DUF3551 domain-containing protein [Xanthobacteraceae bacterium]
MRVLLFVLGILVGAAAIGTRAEAQNYPWCADYGGSWGGVSNCGFTTFQQCMTTLSGMGGFCERNNQYVPAPAAPGPRYRPRHKPHRHAQ